MSTGEESARRIHNGLSRGPSDLSSWPKKRKNQENSLLHPKKPSMEDLRSELLRRDPTARCASLSAPVLAKRLLQLPPKEDNETVATDGQEALRNLSEVAAAVAAAEPAAAEPESQNWKAVVDSVRLLNVLVKLKGPFVERGVTLTREQKCAKKKKPFWDLVPEVFMGNDPDLDAMFGDSGRFADVGLSSFYSGYKITAGKAEEVFKFLRGDHMKIQAKFRKSGNGEGGPVDTISSLCEHSSVFKDFTVGFPVQECFYEILIRHQLLQSAASDLPPGAASSSTDPGSSLVTSYQRRRSAAAAAAASSSSLPVAASSSSLSLATSPRSSTAASSSSSSASAAPASTSSLVKKPHGGKEKTLPAEVVKLLEANVNSPATKAAEKKTIKNMEKKTAASLKCTLVSHYNELTATVDSRQAAMSHLADGEEKTKAEALLKKIKREQMKAEKAAFPDSSSDENSEDGGMDTD